MKIYQGFFFIFCAFAIWVAIAATLDVVFPKTETFYLSKNANSSQIVEFSGNPLFPSYS